MVSEWMLGWAGLVLLWGMAFAVDPQSRCFFLGPVLRRGEGVGVVTFSGAGVPPCGLRGAGLPPCSCVFLLRVGLE